jgi:hypothetical protein
LHSKDFSDSPELMITLQSKRIIGISSWSDT